MSDVFVSYSRRDVEFVRGLHAFLTSAGRDVWVDWDDIPPASKWEQDIDDSIDAAESFVYVVSPSSLASEWCAAELGHAQERGKRIVPLAIDRAEPEDAPTALRELNWIWCRGTDDQDAAFTALAAALDTDLNWARAHTRLLVRAVEWDARSDGSLLLRGRDLAGAERVVAENAGKDPKLTELQQRYLHASRRAATRRQRVTLGAVAAALVVSLALTIVSLIQRQRAIDREQIARSGQLAAKAESRLGDDPELATLLALEAVAVRKTELATQTLRRAVAGVQWRWLARIDDSQELSLAMSDDGRRVAARSSGRVVVLDAAQGRRIDSRPLSDSSGLHLVALDSSGERVATMDEPCRVRLWNVGRAQTVRTLVARRCPESSGGPEDLFFSPDDRWTATDSVAKGRTFRVWNVRTGRTWIRGAGLLGETSYGSLGPFDAKGRRFVTFDSRAVSVWDVRGRRRVRSLRLSAKDASPDTVLMSADGRWVLGLLGGRSIDESGRFGAVLWRSDGESAWRVSGTYRHAALSPSGRVVALAGYRSVDVYEPPRRRPVARLSVSADTQSAEVFGLVFSRDGRQLAAFAGDRITVWRGPRWRSPVVFRGHTGTVFDANFDATGRLLISGAEDGTVRAWPTNQRVTRPYPDEHQTIDLEFGAGGRILMTAGRGRATIWDARTGKRIAILPHNACKGGCGDPFALSPDGRSVAWSANGRLGVWSVALRRDLWSRTAPWRPQPQFSADGTRVLATGPETLRPSRDGSGPPDIVQGRDLAWDAVSGHPLRVLPGRLVGESRTGDRAITYMKVSRHARLWDVRSQRLVADLGPVDVFDEVLVDATGRRVAVLHSTGGGSLWDGSSGSLVAKLVGSPSLVTATAFSPDGTRLLAGHINGLLDVWDAQDGSVLARVRGAPHGDRVEAVDVSNAGFIASQGSDDAHIRIFDSHNALVATLPPPSIDSRLRGFTPDGRAVVVFSYETQPIRILNCDICVGDRELVSLAKRKVPRALTREERRTQLAE